ncbi:translation machinery-associated protein 16 [Tilletia horrida]|nr:translation machinery-associated protein 16 [Tilletia horrida]
MGGKKITAKSIRRKNEPMHPDSRRAAQLTRAATRVSKLQSQKSSRKIHNINKVDRISTFILLLPDDIPALPDLAAMHAWVQDSWLPRHDEELAEARASRRPGRPPLKEEIAIQHRIEAERTEYGTALELPDLTSPANVKLLREWKGNPQGLNAFRFVRISGKFPEQFTIVQEGIHPDLKYEKEQQQQKSGSASSLAGDKAMEEGESTSFPPSRLGAAGDFYNMG